MNFVPIVTTELSIDEMDVLKKRFGLLSEREELWEEIKEKYTESGRAYHNLSHIYSLFQLLEVSNFTKDNPIMEWSIWYHDIIYNAKKKDNEEKSALLFKERCLPFLDNKLLDDVETVILSTIKHFPLSEISEVKWMLDLDLYILSAPFDTYQKYAEAVRIEYGWVPKILYKRGRKKVLESFLKRDRIYFSDYFYETCEERARQNLEKERSLL